MQIIRRIPQLTKGSRFPVVEGALTEVKTLAARQDFLDNIDNSIKKIIRESGGEIEEYSEKRPFPDSLSSKANQVQLLTTRRTLQSLPKVRCTLMNIAQR